MKRPLGVRGAGFMALLVLWGGLPGVYGLPRCLSAVWCAEDGCDGDRERLGGARMHAYEVIRGRADRGVSHVWRDHTGV